MKQPFATALLTALLLVALVPAGRAGDSGDGKDTSIQQADPYPTLRKLRPRPSPQAIEEARRQIETERRIKPFVDAFHAVQAVTNAIYGNP